MLRILYLYSIGFWSVRQLPNILSSDHTSGATHKEVHVFYLITGSTAVFLSQFANSTRPGIKSLLGAFLPLPGNTVLQFVKYRRCIFQKYIPEYLQGNLMSSYSFCV